MGSYYKDRLAGKCMSKVQKSIFILLLLFSVDKVFAQNVESISSELLKDVSANEVYWVVDVVCKGANDSKSIQQRAGETDWCSTDSSEVCADSKTSLAEMICDAGFELAEIAEIEETPEAPIVIDESSPIPEPETIPQQAADIPAPKPVESVAPTSVDSTPVNTTISAPEPEVNSVAEEPEIIETVPTIPIASRDSANSPASSNNSSAMTAEEIAIEEELIRVEQEILELQLKSIELEQ